MIPKECKRLAEVDFPIAEVSRHAAREKSIRHGHPSTLHLWWARRPLAACRAMLLALLWPDPCDACCPVEFKRKARALFPSVQGAPSPSDQDLRRALLKFIADFANWDLAAHPKYLEVSRALVRAAYPEEPPLVVDPFAGGGSIPLEALRVGCDAFASDLNPVACLILKAMLEDIPRATADPVVLADRLRQAGAEVRDLAAQKLSQFFPHDPDGAVPIAYLWARTVRCESPKCGAQLPLVRSFALSTKRGKEKALRYEVRRTASHPPRLEFELIKPAKATDVQAGTVQLGKAVCPACGSTLQRERIRAQLTSQNFGADTATLLAVVCSHPERRGRVYRLPTSRDFMAVSAAREYLQSLVGGQAVTATMVPMEQIPARNKRNSGFGPVLYGAMSWRDLFSARQLVSLVVLTELVAARWRRANEAGDVPLVEELLACAISKSADFNSSVSRWASHMEKSVATFGRQAIPILWDWGEVVPIRDSTGAFTVAVEWIASAVSTLSRAIPKPGQVELADASKPAVPNEAADVWFTDPPYYDAIAYSDLSDYFFVWLKRALPNHRLLGHPLVGANGLTPKDDECIENIEYEVNGHPKDREFFETKLGSCFAAGARTTNPAGIGCVVFAHKTTEGWEALLSAMLRGGWAITASWPIATEKESRLVARNTAALATSVHLVCRPRSNDSTGDWGQVLRELPRRVSDWMVRLQSEGIRGADLVFACIGPALEIYSKYSRVVDAEDREIPLGGDPEAKEPHKRGYLAYVWEVVGKTALEQVLGAAETNSREGAAGALEEDARLTALFLWTLQTTSAEDNGEESVADVEADTVDDEDEQEGTSGRRKPGFRLIYDVARRFAQPLGIHLETWEGRIIETKKGVVRLLPIRERARILFGEAGADIAADRIERAPAGAVQLDLFAGIEPEAAAPPAIRGRGRGRRRQAAPDESLETRQEATTLDRVHAAMLLQASGRSNALRGLLAAEMSRSPDFLRLANALAALYPKGSEEKRLVEAMLLAAPK